MPTQWLVHCSCLCLVRVFCSVFWSQRHDTSSQYQFQISLCFISINCTQMKLENSTSETRLNRALLWWCKAWCLWQVTFANLVGRDQQFVRISINTIVATLFVSDEQIERVGHVCCWCSKDKHFFCAIPTLFRSNKLINLSELNRRRSINWPHS